MSILFYQEQLLQDLFQQEIGLFKISFWSNLWGKNKHLHFGAKTNNGMVQQKFCKTYLKETFYKISVFYHFLQLLLKAKTKTCFLWISHFNCSKLKIFIIFSRGFGFWINVQLPSMKQVFNNKKSFSWGGRPNSQDFDCWETWLQFVPLCSNIMTRFSSPYRDPDQSCRSFPSQLTNSGLVFF